MAVTIPIISEFDGKGIQRAIAEFKSLEGAGAKAQFALKKAALPAAAALTALGAAATVSVKEAITAEAQQSRLNAILRTTTGATDDQIEVLNKQAMALQKVGVASAGNIKSAQAQLATFDLQISTIEKLTPALTDYVIAEKGATASAEDFKSMTNALAGALNGNFGALARSGFQLDEQTKAMISNGNETERAAALVDVLNSTYKGFNETARKTTEGQLVAMQNAFADLKVAIGTALLPALNKLVDFGTKVAEMAEQNKTAFLILGGVIGGFASLILVANFAMKAYAAGKLAVAAATFIVTKAQLLFNAALLANPIGLVVLAIAGLVAAFVFLEVKFGFVTKAMQLLNQGFQTFIINPLRAVLDLVAKVISALGKLPGVAKIAGGIGGAISKVIPGLADGGIVTSPTLAMIGEGGEPEAVIPLSQLHRYGGGGGINITINSTVADDRLGDVIVNALRQYNRRSGPINVAVA